MWVQLSSQQQMLQPFYGSALSFRNGMSVDFECSLKAGVPKQGLGGLDGFPQLGQKRSGPVQNAQTPPGVPTFQRLANPDALSMCIVGALR